MAKSKRVGLREIASRVNCNVSTVSRALNGHPGVSVENARNILKIAYELGYCNSQEKRIAVLLPKSTIPLFWYSMSLLNAIREEVVKRQLLLEFVFADQVEKMLERSISGILSFEFLENSQGKLIEIVPMVFINSFPTISRDIHSVSSNVAQGIAQAVSLLHSYGHRKIGLFLSGDQTRHTREVKTAFMEQCEYYNMEHEIGPGLEKLQKQYYRYGSVRELVESGVTAIIANGESESTEVLAGIQLCGKVVPRDISLICWEVPSFSKFLNPPLTTISQDFPRLAATAFTLLEQIAHKENPPFSIQVDCLLTERNSVTVPPPGR